MNKLKGVWYSLLSAFLVFGMTSCSTGSGGDDDGDDDNTSFTLSGTLEALSFDEGTGELAYEDYDADGLSLFTLSEEAALAEGTISGSDFSISLPVPSADQLVASGYLEMFETLTISDEGAQVFLASLRIFDGPDPVGEVSSYFLNDDNMSGATDNCYNYFVYSDRDCTVTGSFVEVVTPVFSYTVTANIALEKGWNILNKVVSVVADPLSASATLLEINSIPDGYHWIVNAVPEK